MPDQPRWRQMLARLTQPAGQAGAPQQRTANTSRAAAAAPKTDLPRMANQEDEFDGRGRPLTPQEQQANEFWAWTEEAGVTVDLGHQELLTQIRDRADRAVTEGEYSAARDLGVLADQLAEHWGWDEDYAVRDAMTHPEETRQAFLDARREEIRQRTATNPTMRLLDGADIQATTTEDNAVVTPAEAAVAYESDHEAGARLQRERTIERAVEHAYVLADDNSGLITGWVNLDALHAELSRAAQQAGREPYSDHDIDAALNRLSRDGATDGSTGRLSTDPDTGRARVIFEDPAPAARDDLTDAPAATDGQVADGVVAEESSSGDGDEFVEKSSEEHFEDWMEHEAAQHYGDLDNTENLGAVDGTEDPVRPELRGKGWLGDQLTDADKETAWKASSGPTAERDLPPYGDWAALGSHRDQEQTRSAEDQDAEHSHGSSDDHQAETADAALDAEKPADAKSADEPVAVVESTACAVAVTRARCVVDRARQQLDAAQQESANERDEELARWHHDDTAAQTEDQHRKGTAAAQVDDPGAGL